MKGRLLALSSAAVLTVYAAGYARTRSAAELLEAEERRPPMPRPGSMDRTPIPAPPQEATLVAARPQARPGPAPTPGTDAASPAKGTIAANVDKSRGNRETSLSTPERTDEKRDVRAVAAALSPAAPKAAPSAASASVGVSNAAAPAAAAPAAAAASSSAANTRAVSSAPAAAFAPVSAPAASSAPLDAPIAAAASAPAPAAAQAGQAEGAAPALAPSLPRWKDGKYTGWGRSRHGDLQATIWIEAGRITASSISQCQTRYPCDWIVKLPGQVVQRQSAEVDYVSGATESATAFYYAVLEALGKAAQ